MATKYFTGAGVPFDYEGRMARLEHLRLLARKACELAESVFNGTGCWIERYGMHLTPEYRYREAMAAQWRERANHEFDKIAAELDALDVWCYTWHYEPGHEDVTESLYKL